GRDSISGRSAGSTVLVHRTGLLLAVGEDPVEVAARARQNPAGPADLSLAARAHHLREREGDLAHQLAQLMGLLADILAHLIPRRRRLIATLGHPCATGVRECEQLAPVGLLRADQALVLELCQGGVDRAGARPPHAAAALLDLLHDLVAVARLLAQQQQRRRADVAATGLAAATAGASTAAEAPERPAELAAGTVGEVVGAVPTVACGPAARGLSVS